MNIYHEQGKRIYTLRQMLGLSQEAIGQLVVPDPSITRQQIVANWEAGRRPAPVDAIATTLGISRDWLDADSDYMWHHRIDEMRRHLKEQLPILQASSPNARFLDVIRIAQEREPMFCSHKFFYAWLHLSEQEYTRIIEGKQEPPTDAYRRLAKITWVPLQWLETGVDVFLDDENPIYTQYRQFIELALERGFSPEHLTGIINSIPKST